MSSDLKQYKKEENEDDFTWSEKLKDDITKDEDWECQVEALNLDQYRCEPCVTGSEELYLKSAIGDEDVYYYEAIRQAHPQRGTDEQQAALCEAECDRDPECIGFLFEQDSEVSRFFCGFDTRGERVRNNVPIQAIVYEKTNSAQFCTKRSVEAWKSLEREQRRYERPDFIPVCADKSNL